MSLIAMVLTVSGFALNTTRSARLPTWSEPLLVEYLTGVGHNPATDAGTTGVGQGARHGR